jgi:hypothetical protein
MNNLNKYYSFLKENNISTYNSLKEYVEQDIFKLKVKEDKENSNLAVIYNDSNSNIENEFVRFFNGVIIDKNTLKIVCYTFDKCSEDNIINENLIDTDLIIQPVYEGTLIRVFYHNDGWNISTKKMINAFNAKWATDKSFGTMFNEIFGDFNEYNNILPNKNYCYSFLMGHVENNILKNDNNYIIHLNTIDLENNSEVDFQLNNESKNIYHISNYKSDIMNMNKESLENYVNSLKNNISMTEIGYMFVNKDGIRQKFIKKNYTEIRELWGNTNNRLFRYLHLRKNPDKLKKYLETFTFDKQQFVVFETYLMNIATFILNIYRNRHISKSITKVPFYLRDIIYKVHGLYLQSKNKVSFQDINVLLHDLDEKKFCFIINNIEKDKNKIEEEKQTELINNVQNSVQNSAHDTETTETSIEMSSSA